MSKEPAIRILLVEDNLADVHSLEKGFSELASQRFQVTHCRLLADALSHLGKQRFDIVLLDLGLPDSAGVETFAKIHQAVPTLPVLVLAGTDDEAVAVQAVEQGALDYFLKKTAQSPLFGKAIRYAIERSQFQQALVATRQKHQQEQEFIGIDRLTDARGTTVTASIYSANPLRKTAPKEFQAFVKSYMELLDQSLECRLFKAEPVPPENLRNIADELGFLRATPRDVIEIHSAALKKLVADVPWQKAQAYLQEGRLTVLELMGYLTGYYRNYYPARYRKEQVS